MLVCQEQNGWLRTKHDNLLIHEEQTKMNCILACDRNVGILARCRASVNTNIMLVSSILFSFSTFCFTYFFEAQGKFKKSCSGK